jgi:hypothetical protein
MKEGVETIYLRKRFGFVKLAIQTGAQLVPAFTFGQCYAYKYWRLGPPLFPDKWVAAVAKALGFAPIFFWGKWGTPIPHQAGPSRSRSRSRSRPRSRVSSHQCRHLRGIMWDNARRSLVR